LAVSVVDHEAAKDEVASGWAIWSGMVGVLAGCCAGVGVRSDVVDAVGSNDEVFALWVGIFSMLRVHAQSDSRTRGW
jgi:hypothetical protein